MNTVLCFFYFIKNKSAIDSSKNIMLVITNVVTSPFLVHFAALYVYNHKLKFQNDQYNSLPFLIIFDGFMF